MPKKSKECPHCGEENDWHHPTIKKFLGQKDNVDFGVDEFRFKYWPESIHFFAKIENKKDFMTPAIKGFGFFILLSVIMFIRNVMSLSMGVFGLYLNTILVVIAVIPVGFYWLKAGYILTLYALSGGDEGPGNIDIEVSFHKNEIKFNCNDPDEEKYWDKLVLYFKRIHNEEKDK